MPLVSEVLSVFFYSAVGPPFCFTTADSGFIECGDIGEIKRDSGFKEFVQRFPERSHVLYRYNRKREWRYFFMWRIFFN
jgi:hypothetical protein